MLNARSRRLALAVQDTELAEPLADAPQLEQALWTELLLDDWALSARVDARLSRALARLGTATGGSAEAVLAEHALDRADSYGLVRADSVLASAALRPAMERAWFEALEQACRERGVPSDNVALASWLAWGRSMPR